jgi:serine/threonine-protein kinase
VVKRLHGRLSSDPMIVRRFRHEAELASFVDSPYVAKVFDSGVVGDVLYIAMEYIDGWPLSRVIAELIQHRELPKISAAVRMIEGAIEGLIVLHSGAHPETGAPLDIIHRDVAPKNIMVGEDGRSRLIDLGIGRSSARDWKTRTGVTVGTPGYMPPEQAFADTVDHRADIYSIGAVIFELLTLTPYIERGPIGKMLFAARVAKPRPPSSIRTDVPKALDDLVMKAVALSPEDRFTSAVELLAALREAVPTRGEEDAAELINDLLWRELAVKKTEVDALLQVPQTALLSTLASDPAPETVSEEIPRPRRTHASRLVPFAIMLAVVSAIFIGRWLGSALEPRERTVQLVPAAKAMPVEAPKVSAVEREPEPMPTSPATKRARPMPPKRVRPSEPPPPRAIVRPAPQPTITPEALLARANALRTRFAPGSGEEREVNDILRELTLGMASRQTRDWSGLARRIEKLEKR